MNRPPHGSRHPRRANTRRTDYDESDVRIRPNPRGSRARTKIRPKHDDAVAARVVTVDRGRFTTLVGEGTSDEREVTAMRARELGRTSIVVGDRVGLVGDTSGAPDTLARLVKVAERDSVLRRTADDTDAAERVIVANANQLVMVTAAADPQPRPRMIDRCLVAAYDAGMRPVMVITKADLADPQEFLSGFEALAVPSVITAIQPDGRIAGLAELRAVLTGADSVLVGHSGVGKSTLVNAVAPHAGRTTGAVNAVTGRGRHTSSSAVGFRVFDDDGRALGWITDTPGVRSFGLGHVRPSHVLEAFPSLAPGEVDCPRGCTHDEQECGLDGYVAAGHAGEKGPARLDSFRRLLRARSGDGEDADGPSPST
ncbi:MAG: ribosome small subunit-dependent GTPase A [Micrococcales bacterium]|nr:MAG: ribosome small subunit-dependent GTPase A [Micrococcales bacterium]